jgi:hypothetical protein
VTLHALMQSRAIFNEVELLEEITEGRLLIQTMENLDLELLKNVAA